MALVNCKLCNNRISTKAKCCPKCGCPNIKREDTADIRVKNCASCNYVPTEPGLTCNLCDVQSAYSSISTERAPVASTDKVNLLNADAMTSSISTRIEALDISRELKDVFCLIASSERACVTSSEMLEGDDSRLKSFRNIDSRRTTFSTLALFLGPAYYFIYGIWKKGALLALIMLSPSLLLLLSMQAAQFMFVGIALYVHVTCYCMAKRDRFRSQVLEKSFWW